MHRQLDHAPENGLELSVQQFFFVHDHEAKRNSLKTGRKFPRVERTC